MIKRALAFLFLFVGSASAARVYYEPGTGSGGGGGGGSASFFTFTENTGNKTAISSMTFETPQFSNTTSGSSTTVRINPSSVTLMGQFTSLALTNGTTIQGNGPLLRLISNDAYPFPIIVGNNAAGTQTGYAFRNGTSTNAYITLVSNTGIMSIVTRGKEMITIDPGNNNAVGISCITPTAALSIASGTNAGNVNLLNISTGNFKLFEVWGASVMVNVPLISRYGVEYATSSGGGGSGGGLSVETDPAFKLFIATFTPGSGSGANFDAYIATAPTNLVKVGSMSVVGTYNSTSNLNAADISATTFTLRASGSGGPWIRAVGGATGIRFDSNNNGFSDFEIWPSSSIDGSGNMMLSQGNVTCTGSVSCTNGVSNFTITGNGSSGEPGFNAYVSTIQTAGITVGSETVKGTITSTSGFIVSGSTINGQLTMNGSGPMTFIGNGIIAFDADNDGSTDTVIAGTSVTITGKQGTSGPLIVISTGGFKLFEVNGTSIVAYVDIISKAGVLYPTSTVGGGGTGGADAGFALFSATGTGKIDAAGGFTLFKSTAEGLINGANGFSLFRTTGEAQIASGAGFTLFKTTGQAQISAAAGFNLAQSTINSKLDNLIAGGTFYIQNTSATTGGVFHVSSGTIESGLTIKGDTIFQTTWYTGVSFPFDAGSSSRVVSGSLYGQNGRFLGDGQQSSGTAVCGYFQKWIPQNYVRGSTPTFTDLVELSTGLLSQQTQWLLDFATSSVVAVSTGLTYTGLTIVQVTGTTSGSSGIRMQTTDQPINGLTNILESGEKFLIVRARRDGANALAADPAQSDTAIGHIGFAIKMQQ